MSEIGASVILWVAASWRSNTLNAPHQKWLFSYTHTRKTASFGLDYTCVTLISWFHRLCLWGEQYRKISRDMWVRKKRGWRFWNVKETTTIFTLIHTFSSEFINNYFRKRKSFSFMDFKCVMKKEKRPKSFRIGVVRGWREWKFFFFFLFHKQMPPNILKLLVKQ